MDGADEGLVLAPVRADLRCRAEGEAEEMCRCKAHVEACGRRTVGYTWAHAFARA